MITWNGSIHCPTVDISAEFAVKILAIEAMPSDEQHFQEWISLEATKLGTGEHYEYYYDAKMECNLKVNFIVILHTLSRTHNHITN